MPTPKVNSWLGWRIFTVNNQGARGPPCAQEHKKGLGIAFSHKESLHTWMLGLDLDSSRWESMLGRDGEQKLLFGTWEKWITVGRQGGINTLRSRSATVTFESPEPPGWIPEPPGTGDFSRLTREQPGTSGKKLRGSEKGVFKSKAASWWVICGWDNFGFRVDFKHLVSSMPLLVSLLIVRLVLYSNSK
jgi:hypothetical protein